MTKVALIFGRSSKFMGVLIRIMDISPWSHVAIYDGGEWVYESVGARYRGRLGRRKGFVKTHIDDFKKRYSAWRLKEIDCHNENWLEDCERMVRDKVEYDYPATLGGIWFLRLLRIKLGSKHAHNCSEAVNAICKRFIDGYSPTPADFWRLTR